MEITRRAAGLPAGSRVSERRAMLGRDRGRAIATALALSLVVATARAQDGAGTGPRVRWDRPPEGTLERGLHGVPSWVVVVLGVLVVAGAAAALVRAARRSARRGR